MERKKNKPLGKRVTYKIMELLSCNSMGAKKGGTNVTCRFQPLHSKICYQLLWKNAFLEKLVIIWKINMSFQTFPVT